MNQESSAMDLKSKNGLWSQYRPMLETVRRMSTHQITTRLSRDLRYRWLYPLAAPRLFSVPSSLNRSLSTPDGQTFHEPGPADNAFHRRLLQEAEGLCHHRFSFLNRPPMKMANQINWEFAPEGDRLWLYTLHYGEWALTLARACLATRQLRFRYRLIRLLADWLDHNPVGRRPGWEPYPVSCRLVAWSKVGMALCGDSYLA
jgi:hypothetical protein